MNKKESTLNFEEAMKTLETLVEALEKGDLSLEDSLEKYEHGVKLAVQCQQVLTQAEQKVSILTNMGTERELLEPYENEKDDLNP